MNSAIAWSPGGAEAAGGQLLQASRRATAVASITVLVTVAASLWLCWDSQVTIRQTTGGGGPANHERELLSQFDLSIFKVAGAAAVGGAVSLGSVLVIQGLWRRRLRECLESQARQYENGTIALQNQLAEARRLREQAQVAQVDLETQVKQLSDARSNLQGELDRRTRMEKALAQKRQELESSKSVLELHVQARTQELQKLQQLYGMILNSAGEGICGLDVEGRTTFVNPAVARMTGLPVEELIGRHESDIFFASFGNGEGNGSSCDLGEEYLYRQDGTRFPVEFVRTPIEENGRVVGSVLVFKDITERKRVEETLSHKNAELARSNSELEQFAFVASHDLQEPLRKIQAFGDRLKGKCQGALPPDALDYLERMHNAAARMRTLIDDLLTFSRVIRSSEPFVPVDLGTVTREVLGDLELRIEKTGATIQTGPMPTIEADPTQMRQLLQNLISNALKFQAPGAKPIIEIASRTVATPSGKEYCEITVKDNGIGFEEKYLERIFAVFQRLHGRTEYEGTGVGLAVCRRIADRHGGSITARSQPGEGATFIITLPLRQTKA